MASNSSTVSMQPRNFGSSINLISGIQGVAPGGQATINMPVANRIHSETFQCTGIAYSSGTTVTFTGGGGSGATASAVVVNGVVTAITVTNGGSGYSSPPTVVITDPLGNGTGATATASLNAGAVDSVTVTNGGVAGPVSADYFFTSAKHLVNGIVMRDILPGTAVAIAEANGLTVPRGQYPVYFTEPWRKIVDHDQATAWDLVGQSTYQVLLGINPQITNPQITGVYEFDYLRNARRGPNGEPMLFLRPIKQSTFTYNVPSGMYNVTSLPVDFPIQRMWLNETGPGSITQVELYQDGNKVLEGTVEQINQTLEAYGFNTSVFDFSIVFDKDQRLGKALSVDNLVMRVYSQSSTTLSITMEIQANNYA